MKIIPTPINCSCFSSQMGVEKGHKIDYFFIYKVKLNQHISITPLPKKKSEG